jgi:regulatory protein
LARPTLPAYERALRLLAQRAHFEAELAGKLAARGYPPEEVAGALARLRAEGYLDDRRSAAEFAAERLRRKPWGRSRLRRELAARGVNGALAAEVAAEEVPEDDREAAREAARRWLRRRPPRGGDPRAALARHLERQGFSRRAIFAALEEIGDPSTSDP